MACRLDARGASFGRSQRASWGVEALRGYLEGRCERTGPKIAASELACLDLVTCNGFQVAESPKRLL